MTKSFQVSDVKNVIYVSSDMSQSCPLCSHLLKADGVAESINHVLSAHNYKLLHVGTETTEDASCNPWHKTVAVLGA